MYKLYFKTKKKLNNNGFTLVELLAVIVVLAIIMLIAIPTILDSLDNAKRKSFETYTNRILSLADQETLKREMDGNSFGEQCFVYNITKDFELNNTGDYKGYVLLQVSANAKKYYVTMWSNDYMLISYNITESIDYYGKKKSIQEALERYDSSREDELTIQSLCNYACNSCSYESDGNKETVNGDPTKIRGATTLLTGTEIRTLFKELRNDGPLIHSIKRSYSLPFDKETKIISQNTGDSANNPVYVWYDDGIIYFYSEATKIFLNRNCVELFAYYSTLNDISDFINSTDTYKVINAQNMFKQSGIEELDLSNWSFENTKYMQAMFYNCSNLKNINLSNFKTGKVENMWDMFCHCTSLEELNINHFDVSRVTCMDTIFYNCNKLKKLDLNSWSISRVKTLKRAFGSCTSLEELNISNWDTSSVIYTSDSYEQGLFYKCSSLKTLDISKWNTSKMVDMLGMFNCCSSLVSIDISKWNTSNVTTMASMFSYCSSLKSLNISNWDTSKVKSMNSMFFYCSSLNDLDITKWNVNSVENLSSMFSFALNGIDKMDLSNWKAYNVNSINNMFCGARIKHLDLTGIHINNVKSLGYIFAVSGLHTIDISTWDNSNVNNYDRMFFDSHVLEHVYIGPNWTTENYASAKYTGEMFRYNNKLHNWDGTCNYTHANANNDGYFEYK